MSDKIQLKKGVTHNTTTGSDYKLGDVEKPNRRARRAIIKYHKKKLKRNSI